MEREQAYVLAYCDSCVIYPHPAFRTRRAAIRTANRINRWMGGKLVKAMGYRTQLRQRHFDLRSHFELRG